MNQQGIGHLIALFTVGVWGTTFIATKILLGSFSPIEILLIRFLIGFLCLSIACPHVLHLKNKRQELYFAAAGLCGVTLYFLFENIALTYTMASNVGVIVAISPFFTALFSRIRKPGAKLAAPFFYRLSAGHRRHCHHQLQRPGAVAQPKRRFSSRRRGHCVVGLHHPNQKNRQLRLLGAAKHPSYFLLRLAFDDSGAAADGFSSAAFCHTAAAKFGQLFIFRLRRVSLLLCQLECGRQSSGRCQNRRLYLSHSCYLGHFLRAHLTGTNHTAGALRYGAHPAGANHLGGNAVAAAETKFTKKLITEISFFQRQVFLWNSPAL